MIPYSTQCIEQDDIDAVSKALKKEILTGGNTVDDFERMFADYIGAKYAVAVSSGTAALHVACAAIGIHSGDEVITTPNTWISSANCVIYCGGQPVFADIDPVSYNVDPRQIEEKITPKTRAVIVVHYAGQPCDMDAINKIARKYKLFVIEDAAHAVGSFYHGKKIGGLSDITTFSFHPVKQMTTCEGGMITTNDEDIYKKAKLFRAYGMVKNHDDAPWLSEQLSLGYNYRLSDVACALGISQLSKVDRFVIRRREIAEYYDKELTNIDGLVLPRQSDGVVSSYHLYPVLVKAEQRKDLYLKLHEAGIGVSVHYFPVYKHRYYQDLGYASVCCPVAEDFYARELSLPIHSKMTDDDVIYVVSVIKKMLR